MTDQLIEWNDQFRLGIAEIDHEHQEMIMLINQLHGRLAADAGTEDVLPGRLRLLQEREDPPDGLDASLPGKLARPRLPEGHQLHAVHGRQRDVGQRGAGEDD